MVVPYFIGGYCLYFKFGQINYFLISMRDHLFGLFGIQLENLANFVKGGCFNFKGRNC